MADLSVAGALALVLYLVFVIVRWLYWRSRPKTAAVATTDPADDPLPEAPAARRGAPAPAERRESRGRGERVEPRL